MARASHCKFLKKVAETTHRRGWAVGDINTLTFLQTVDAWGFPLYPDETVILSETTDLYSELANFMEANGALLRQPEAWLGTWCHPKTSRIYLDVTTSLPDLDSAVSAVQTINSRSTRKIEAIYNSALNEALFLTPLDIL